MFPPIDRGVSVEIRHTLQKRTFARTSVKNEPYCRRKPERHPSYRGRVVRAHRPCPGCGAPARTAQRRRPLRAGPRHGAPFLFLHVGSTAVFVATTDTIMSIVVVVVVVVVVFFFFFFFFFLRVIVLLVET